MKILYIAIGGIESPGVSKKILNKINAFNEAQINTYGLLFTLSEKKYKSPQYEIVPLNINTPNWLTGKFFWRFLYLYREMMTYKRVHKIVKQHNFDFIIFRYPGSNFALRKFTSTYRDKIVFEINARTLVDLRNYNVHNSFLDKYRIFSEKYFFKGVVKNAKALMAVTEDILTDEMSRSEQIKPSLVLSNGVDVRSIPLRAVPKVHDNVINMCICIGSFNISVFGLERLARSIKEYRGNYKFNVYIAGVIKDEQLKEFNAIAGNEIFHSKGMLDTNELNQLYSRCHVAFAALAMYKLDANYSSSLKVKEYLAAGIPFFLAYTEPVLKEIDHIKSYYLVYENNESLLDLNVLVDFVISCVNDPNHPVKIRENAFAHIDYLNKAKELKGFLARLN